MKRRTSILILIVLFVFVSCSKEEEPIEKEKQCYEYWTNCSRDKTYTGGTVTITDLTTMEMCTYDAHLHFTYSYTDVFSMSITADVSPFDSCSNFGVSIRGYIENCRTDYLTGESSSGNYRSEIFVAKDGNSFEGFAEEYRKDPSTGVETKVSSFIFSVPF